MLTIFATPKPFSGLVGVIQRNAIRSWVDLDPDCQVILLGQEDGIEDAAREFAVEHVAEIELNEHGTPLLDSVFRRAEQRARHETLCYVNGDILLPPTFLEATKRAAARPSAFLMIGECLDIDLPHELTSEELHQGLSSGALGDGGTRRGPWAIDYFVFRRGTLGTLPPFAVGRASWDTWMIYRARQLRMTVIDATPSTQPLHQNHTYHHVKQATGDKWQGPESETNRSIIGRAELESLSLDDVTHRLEADQLVRLSLRRRLRTSLIVQPRLFPLYQLLRRAPGSARVLRM